MLNFFRAALSTALLVLSAFGTTVSAQYVVITNEYNEFTDIGYNWYQAFSNGDRVYPCDPQPKLVVDGFTVTVTIDVQIGAPLPNFACTSRTPPLRFGPLPPGLYTINTRYTGAEDKTSSLKFLVEDSKKACMADAARPATMYVSHMTKDADTLAAELADPARRAALGNPIAVRAGGSPFSPSFGHTYNLDYEAPRNLLPIALQLRKEFRSATFGGCITFSGGGSSPPAALVEFYHPTLDHYFYTATAAEIAAIEAGSAGQGWARTGEWMDVETGNGCGGRVEYSSAAGGGLRPAYRFYGRPGKGPNSHFFTISRGECYAVTQDGGWQYEGSPFFAAEPQPGGLCASYMNPVYRLYNNRAAQNDSNHRFTTKQAIVQEMTAKGWINEGVAMCVRKL